MTSVARRGFLAAGAVLGIGALSPEAAWAGRGHYQALLLTCIDPRLPKLTLDHMAMRSLLGQYSHFSIAGASIGVVAPTFSAWRQAFWDNLAASIHLHNISSLIVLNHRDCGAARIAYGDSAVATRDAETATHRSALLAFRAEAGERQPGLRIDLGLMGLNGEVESFN